MPQKALSEVSTSRVEALRKKHLAVEAQIIDAIKSPSMADYYIKNLKKQKLMIKEELEALRKERKSAA